MNYSATRLRRTRTTTTYVSAGAKTNLFERQESTTMSLATECSTSRTTWAKCCNLQKIS